MLCWLLLCWLLLCSGLRWCYCLLTYSGQNQCIRFAWLFRGVCGKTQSAASSGTVMFRLFCPCRKGLFIIKKLGIFIQNYSPPPSSWILFVFASFWTSGCFKMNIFLKMLVSTYFIPKMFWTLESGAMLPSILVLVCQPLRIKGHPIDSTLSALYAWDMNTESLGAQCHLLIVNLQCRYSATWVYFHKILKRYKCHNWSATADQIKFR